jgi:hypothetical protein
LSSINFQRTYRLGETYKDIRKRANQILAKYQACQDLVVFNDANRSVTFASEKLIPTVPTNRPRVMLLFSNPHPLSIQKGMFLSPNSKGQESLFWPVMEEAGWIDIPKSQRIPEKLIDICLEARYRGPFELIFYCYYAFPTDFPEDIGKIFGEDFFRQTIGPEAMAEFNKTIQETSVKAVVTFNKGIFNLVSTDQIERYIECLIDGELIQSHVIGIDREIPIFLTFPTGWRYKKGYMQLRKDSLDTIRKAISHTVRI